VLRVPGRPCTIQGEIQHAHLSLRDEVPDGVLLRDGTNITGTAGSLAVCEFINDVIHTFKESDLTVKVKNGKVYVSLAEQLLFQSGSTEVDTKGVAALQELAKALKGQTGLQVTVEGHTDSDAFLAPSGYMTDNWDLSVLRATAITRILTKAGVSPGQITSSGKGEYSPLVDNNSKENKRKNRRTEIIITPQLDDLFNLLETN